MSELRYGLMLPDDQQPLWLDGTSTIGRHLDNDIVLAGEDVRDYHVRLDATARGPRLIVLDGATVHVADVAVEGTIGLAPDDEFTIGRNAIRVIIDGAAGSCRWALHEPGVSQGIPIGRDLLVGRADDAAIKIIEGHVSRRHASMRANGRWVWIKDLGSSNGTFINGERLHGASRLFHGDEIAFDQIRYQLIGDAPDLTPIRPPGESPDQLPVGVEAAATPVSATVEIGAVGAEAADAQVPAQLPPAITGPTLWGRSGPISGQLFPLAFGRQTIGRGADVDLVIGESSVSLNHAELELKPDGAYLVNLISTNGTWVNGVEIHTRRLHAGDVIHFGRVRADYLEPRVPPRYRKLGVWWIALVAALGAVIAYIVQT